MRLFLLAAFLIGLALLCGWFSFGLMHGFVDCRLDEPFFNHTIPSPTPTNCASSTRLLTQKIVFVFAVGIAALSVLMPILINMREDTEQNDEVDSLRLN